jgi:hypothetical protein
LSENDPKLRGWKPRGCAAEMRGGSLVVTAHGDAPFLGFAAGRLSGPAVVRFRVRSAAGGAGKVEWLPTPQAADQAKSVPWRIEAGDWREVRTEVPATGPLGVLRLYLPAAKPVEVDWIEIIPDKGKLERYDF